jgi:hypothetical protein
MQIGEPPSEPLLAPRATARSSISSGSRRTGASRWWDRAELLLWRHETSPGIPKEPEVDP